MSANVLQQSSESNYHPYRNDDEDPSIPHTKAIYYVLGGFGSLLFLALAVFLVTLLETHNASFLLLLLLCWLVIFALVYGLIFVLKETTKYNYIQHISNEIQEELEAFQYEWNQYQQHGLLLEEGASSFDIDMQNQDQTGDHDARASTRSNTRRKRSWMFRVLKPIVLRFPKKNRCRDRDER